jgi:hypothetical protein
MVKRRASSNHSKTWEFKKIIMQLLVIWNDLAREIQICWKKLALYLKVQKNIMWWNARKNDMVKRRASSNHSKTREFKKIIMQLLVIWNDLAREVQICWKKLALYLKVQKNIMCSNARKNDMVKFCASSNHS